MRVVRIHRCVESDTITLPELKQFIGKEVEILVMEETRSPSQDSKEQRDYSALTGIAGQDLIDPDAYLELRAASMI